MKKKHIDLFTRPKRATRSMTETDWIQLAHEAEFFAKLDFVHSTLSKGFFAWWASLSNADRERFQRILRDAKEQAAREVGHSPREMASAAVGLLEHLREQQGPGACIDAFSDMDRLAFEIATRARRRAEPPTAEEPE